MVWANTRGRYFPKKSYYPIPQFLYTYLTNTEVWYAPQLIKKTLIKMSQVQLRKNLKLNRIIIFLDTISTYLSHESMLRHRYGHASQNGSSYYGSLGSQVYRYGHMHLKMDPSTSVGSRVKTKSLYIILYIFI